MYNNKYICESIFRIYKNKFTNLQSLFYRKIGTSCWRGTLLWRTIRCRRGLSGPGTSRILPSMNEVYYNLQSHYYHNHLYEYACERRRIIVILRELRCCVWMNYRNSSNQLRDRMLWKISVDERGLCRRVCIYVKEQRGILKSNYTITIFLLFFSRLFIIHY